MDDSQLLKESNLTAMQPRRAPHHVMYTSNCEWRTCPKCLRGAVLLRTISWCLWRNTGAEWPL